VTILGTDINRHSLARAREGRFEEWALRSMRSRPSSNTFLKNHGKSWTIAPKYKEGRVFPNATTWWRIPFRPDQQPFAFD